MSTITEDPVDSIGTESEDGLHEIAVGHPSVYIGKTGVEGDASYLDDGHDTIAIKADGCCTEITEACKVGVFDYVLALVEQCGVGGRLLVTVDYWCREETY